MPFFFYFLFIKEYWRQCIMVSTKTLNNTVLFLDQQISIWMISERSCDTEDWMLLKIQLNITNKLHFSIYSNRKVIFNCKNSTQYYCFYCIFDQISEHWWAEETFYGRLIKINLSDFLYMQFNLMFVCAICILVLSCLLQYCNQLISGS